MIYKIDAKNKILGRLASEIAILLRGKNKPDFSGHVLSINKVEVANIAEIKISGNKADQKIYWHYTGYPGGVKGVSYRALKQKNPGRILKHAVYGMLPKNKLRAQMMRNLIIT